MDNTQKKELKEILKQMDAQKRIDKIIKPDSDLGYEKFKKKLLAGNDEFDKKVIESEKLSKKRKK